MVIEDSEFDKVPAEDMAMLNDLRIYREMPAPDFDEIEVQESHAPKTPVAKPSTLGGWAMKILTVLMLSFAAWQWFKKYGDSFLF